MAEPLDPELLGKGLRWVFGDMLEDRAGRLPPGPTGYAKQDPAWWTERAEDMLRGLSYITDNQPWVGIPRIRLLIEHLPHAERVKVDG